MAELHADARTDPRVLGTLCCHVRWHVPPITSRSPGPGCNPTDGPPPVGRSRNGRTAPSDTSATVADGSSLATRSPCHATLSAPSR